jgi:hypothetical protein
MGLVVMQELFYLPRMTPIDELFPLRDESEFDELEEERKISEYYRTLYTEQKRRTEEFQTMMLPKNRTN